MTPEQRRVKQHGRELQRVEKKVMKDEGGRGLEVVRQEQAQWSRETGNDYERP